jgi:hypothetical protein
MRLVAKSLLSIGLAARLAATGCRAHSSGHPTGGSSNEIFGVGSAPTGGHFQFLRGGETIAVDQLRRGWRYRFIGELRPRAAGSRLSWEALAGRAHVEAKRRVARGGEFIAASGTPVSAESQALAASRPTDSVI